MTGQVFVDTNILVYAVDGADQRKQAIARQVLAAGVPVISAQVLGEFYVTVTRKLATPMSPEQAQAVVAQWAQARVVPLDSAAVSAAIETSIVHQLSYWDALIVETAALAGCDEILTEDLAAGTIIRGVRISNPFSSPSAPTP